MVGSCYEVEKAEKKMIISDPASPVDCHSNNLPERERLLSILLPHRCLTAADRTDCTWICGQLPPGKPGLADITRKQLTHSRQFHRR